MYYFFVPAALSLLLILTVTIKDQIGSKPQRPMLEQIEEARN